MREFLVVVQAAYGWDEFNAAASAIADGGGRVLQRFPPRVLIGSGGDPLVAALSHLAGVEVFVGAVPAPETRGLDEAGLLAVQAWNARSAPAFRAAKAARPDEGKPWDFHGRREGGDAIAPEHGAAPFAEGVTAKAAPRNTSRYLIGTVAVGVVIVDGPPNSTAAFTAQERANVVAEVQEGANGLIGLAPAGANVDFIFDVHTVTLNLDPAQVTGEGDWADVAMAGLGYSAGDAGKYDYLHDLRTTRWPALPSGPDWAYIAFFTKYAAFWFAYARLGGPHLVMQYSNDGWGSGQIDRVFAHESGHVFWAPDEYASSGCSVGGSYGYLGVPNDNCEVNNPGSVDCLMKGNTYQVCQWTAGHFGWRDVDTDGIPDPIDLAPGTYATDVGLDPGAPFYDNASLWIRNQDDGEASSVHQNPRSNIDNFIYAQVKNFGGVVAEVVRARFYIAPYAGTQFVYPDDYTNLITAPDTPYPTVFALGPGNSAIAKARLRQAQIPPTTWHPCLLSHISCAQDAPVPVGTHCWESNNLGQRNLVVEYVAPAFRIRVPVMLVNLGDPNPVFELRRARAGEALKIELQLLDRRLRPESLPHAPQALQPGVVAAARTEVAPQGRVGIRFLGVADVALTMTAAPDVLLHLAPNSVLNLGDNAGASLDGEWAAEGAEAPAPIERAERISLPLPARKSVRWRLPMPSHSRKVATFTFQAPASARVGEMYRTELNQYDAGGRLTGGIAFELRVVSHAFALKEFQWRLSGLRYLADRSGSRAMADLADAADALIARHITAAEGRAADPVPARRAFAGALRNASRENVWRQASGRLCEVADGLERNGSLLADLDALSLVMTRAQERLLADLAS